MTRRSANQSQYEPSFRPSLHRFNDNNNSVRVVLVAIHRGPQPAAFLGSHPLQRLQVLLTAAGEEIEFDPLSAMARMIAGAPPQLLPKMPAANDNPGLRPRLVQGEILSDDEGRLFEKIGRHIRPLQRLFSGPRGEVLEFPAEARAEERVTEPSPQSLDAETSKPRAQTKLHAAARIEATPERQGASQQPFPRPAQQPMLADQRVRATAPREFGAPPSGELRAFGKTHPPEGGTTNPHFKPFPSEGIPNSRYQTIPPEGSTTNRHFKPFPPEGSTTNPHFKPMPSGGIPNSRYQTIPPEVGTTNSRSQPPEGGTPNQRIRPLPPDGGDTGLRFKTIPPGEGVPNSRYTPIPPEIGTADTIWRRQNSAANPGAGANGLKTTIQEQWIKPWEFQISREEAIYDMRIAASYRSALFVFLRGLTDWLGNRQSWRKWQALLSGKSLDEQLWAVRPPRGMISRMSVRDWARQALEQAGYDARVMLVEWEIFWRRKGCSQGR